jgi:hypothetical protein
MSSWARPPPSAPATNRFARWVTFGANPKNMPAGVDRLGWLFWRSGKVANHGNRPELPLKDELSAVNVSEFEGLPLIVQFIIGWTAFVLPLCLCFARNKDLWLVISCKEHYESSP